MIQLFMSNQQSFSTKLGVMCLAQGHNAVTPVRLEPAAPLSRVKHSTTEPLRSLNREIFYVSFIILNVRVDMIL